ncbi:hypothetical protein J4E82_008974 [Alternaria postmessia]|uniref:uncharacterized protein n=1 Tax=Alternaria postmessia TaxID=1187938 RepID=UPI00222502C2|nr:uncharacterized protein J4E82_008974 [Alternaria postmessia]KAI5372334.1 hypothetical protein J4E82_008974 [Alternaria postmessia]
MVLEVHKKRKRDYVLEIPERERENEQQQHRQLDGKHDEAEQFPTNVPSAAPPSEKPGSKSDPTKTSVRSEAEPERKIIEIEETRHHQDECATSYTALEQEVQSLQDDKRAFEELKNEEKKNENANEKKKKKNEKKKNENEKKNENANEKKNERTSSASLRRCFVSHQSQW